jgi:CIC family chloride channel protein
LRLKLRTLLHTTAGGLVVGILAVAAPQVMSSGHGALRLTGMGHFALSTIALFFVLKIAASIVSLGSGFRGGMFFSSLLMGALGGHLVAGALAAIAPEIALDPNAYALIGMSALSASVIGGPLTMTFIALETTGDLWLTTAVLIAVIIAAQVTREAFGYSFATWRFHLRGETIRSAADVGWMRDLTVGRMMRHDVRTIPVATTIAAFRATFPLGSTATVIAVDKSDRYAGMVQTAEVHAAAASADQSIKALLRYTDAVLLPGMAIREAVLAFDRAEAEALAVVDSFVERRVVGLLSEAHALRRYAAELERRRQELVGEE